ncbi:MAG: sel1 repeat family protein [Ectothiorhodospiraceae bacterium]|nr:sel1 repeat family protein [Ectothiorhodospiraceae bacterium]
MHYTQSTPYQHISRRLLTATLFLGLWLPFHVFSSDFEGLEAGQKAFNAGNFTLSFALWTTLATQGHTDAQVFVGLSYQNGWGIQKSSQLAEVWYQKAAKKNNAIGQYLLGLRYIQGSNTNRAKGLMWLRQAASNGDNSAQQFLKKGQARGWFTDIPTAATSSTVTPPALTAPSSSPLQVRKTVPQSQAFAG